MCGAITFEAGGRLRDVVNCHCYRCRRWSGHYWAATSCDADHLAVADSHHALRWYSPAEGVEYGFCQQCGSSLFWRITERPQLVAVSAGCLDQPTGLRTSIVVWNAEHGDYHPPIPHLVEYDHDLPHED